MAIKKAVKKARDVITDYLIAYIGEKAVAGTPHYDKVKKFGRYRYSVIRLAVFF
jgi:hypothetical protein